MLAPSSPCPHCGRTTKTVQGVCADCWGSKGGRLLWMRKSGPDTSELQEILGFDPLHPVVLTAVAIGIPALLALLLWILG